jgi:HSP20 family protein
MKPEPFSQEVSRLFNTLFEPANFNGSQRWTPAMDLVEADDHFVLKADLPGMSEGDVSIEVQDNVLTISGERRAAHERKERGWCRIERAFGRFSRSLSLPEGVDAESVTASFDRGVLEVRVPKPEQKVPKKIEIAVEGTATERS